jgi:hypothetical protein
VGVSVYVMPLTTYLSGNFRTTWGGGGDSGAAPRPRRSGVEVQADVGAFEEQLERLLEFRPDWDEEGPVRSATIFSLDGFSAPFLQARQWAYRLKLPLLGALEPPQIWIPAEFEPVVHLAPHWNPETEVAVVSSQRLKAELERLLEAIAGEERADLADACQVTDRLRGIAALSVEHLVPVIVES